MQRKEMAQWLVRRKKCLTIFHLYLYFEFKFCSEHLYFQYIKGIYERLFPLSSFTDHSNACILHETYVFCKCVCNFITYHLHIYHILGFMHNTLLLIETGHLSADINLLSYFDHPKIFVFARFS